MNYNGLNFSIDKTVLHRYGVVRLLKLRILKALIQPLTVRKQFINVYLYIRLDCSISCITTILSSLFSLIKPFYFAEKILEYTGTGIFFSDVRAMAPIA